MQEKNLGRAKTVRPIIVEVGGEPQGIVVPENGGFRFVAVRLPAFAIDGQHFETIEAARRAASVALRADKGNGH
ncbi:hypothetical protein [Devosia sp. 1566]|uniref:hypothetical protein n=1 Tax=Devosia sp. 1566 TaxID=2499144 RepID=UPI000FD85EE3|nr:hypothetical protein [Devosia sp. 1566]